MGERTRTFPTTSARTWRRPTPGRSPMRRVTSSLRRAAFQCQRNSVLLADEICQSEPLTKCEDVPRQSCHKEHRRVPIRVSEAFPRRPAPPTFSQPQPQPLWFPSLLLSSQDRSRKLRKRFLFPSPCPLCLPPSSDLMRGSLTATTSSSEPSPRRLSMWPS